MHSDKTAMETNHHLHGGMYVKRNLMCAQQASVSVHLYFRSCFYKDSMREVEM